MKSSWQIAREPTDGFRPAPGDQEGRFFIAHDSFWQEEATITVCQDEADYARAKMDEAMKRVCSNSGDFIPFEKRYDWLPEIRYGHKP